VRGINTFKIKAVNLYCDYKNRGEENKAKSIYYFSFFNKDDDWRFFNRIKTIDFRNKLYRISNSDTPEFIFYVHQKNRSVSISPDSKLVVTNGFGRNAVIWEVENGECFKVLSGHKGVINAVSFSPDGKYILTASADETAMLWDLKNGNIVNVFKGHSAEITNASFSPSGRYIVTASADKTAIIWDIKTSNIVHILDGHTNGVTAAFFSKDGKSIVTSSLDKTAIVWDAKTGNVIRRLESDRGITFATFSPNGRDVVTTSVEHFFENGAEVFAYNRGNLYGMWNIETGSVVKIWKDIKKAIAYFYFSPDGKYVLGTSSDAVLILNISDGSVINTLNTSSPSISYGNKCVVTFSASGVVEFWGVEDTSMLKKIAIENPLTKADKNYLGFNYVRWQFYVLILGLFIVIVLCYNILKK
jgi:WD40 repeat protein